MLTVRATRLAEAQTKMAFENALKIRYLPEVEETREKTNDEKLAASLAQSDIQTTISVFLQMQNKNALGATIKHEFIKSALRNHIKLRPTPELALEIQQLVMNVDDPHVLEDRVFVDLMSCYLKLRQTQQAQILLKWMFDTRLVPNYQVINSILKLYGETDGMRESTKALIELAVSRNVVITVDTWCIYIKVMAHNDPVWIIECLAILKTITESNVAISIQILSTCLWSFAKFGMAKGVNKIISIIETKNFPKTRSVYHLQMSSLVKAKKYQEVEHIFGTLMNGEDRHRTRTTDTFNIMMDMYSRQFDAESSLKLLNQMKLTTNLKPDIVSFNTAIRGYAHKQDAAMVSKLFNEIHEYGLKPTSRSYHMLISTFMGNGQFDKCRDVFRMVCSSGIVPESTTYVIMMRHYNYSGNTDEVRAIYADFKRRGIRPDVGILREIMACENLAGDKEEFKKLFDVAVRLRCLDMQMCNWMAALENSDADEAKTYLERLLSIHEIIDQKHTLVAKASDVTHESTI